jgi:hypothetical protein
MKRWGLPIIIIAAVAVLVAIFALGNKSSSDQSSNNAVAVKQSPDGLPGLLTTTAPWDKNTDKLADRSNAIGLPLLSGEGSVLHIHQHLDLYVDGQKVEVPEGIGIPTPENSIAVIHVHDTSGVLHVESDVQRDYFLGEFFDTWGVKFTKDILGGYTASGDKHLKVYINGQLYNGDPRQAKLDAHQEIVVAYGTDSALPNPIPSSYQFPDGE